MLLLGSYQNHKMFLYNYRVLVPRRRKEHWITLIGLLLKVRCHLLFEAQIEYFLIEFRARLI